MVQNAAASLKANAANKPPTSRAPNQSSTQHNETPLESLESNQQQYRQGSLHVQEPMQESPLRQGSLPHFGAMSMGMGGQLASAFDSLDLNQDGVLDRSEFENLMATMTPPHCKPSQASTQASPGGGPRGAGGGSSLAYRMDDAAYPTTGAAGTASATAAGLASPSDSETTKLLAKLLAAAKTGAAWEISELVAAKANLNLSGPDGKAPLHLGAMFGQVVTIAALCQAINND